MQKIKNKKFSNSLWHYIRLYLECIQDSVKKCGACRFKMHDFRVFMEISFQLVTVILLTWGVNSSLSEIWTPNMLSSLTHMVTDEKNSTKVLGNFVNLISVNRLYYYLEWKKILCTLDFIHLWVVSNVLPENVRCHEFQGLQMLDLVIRETPGLVFFAWCMHMYI